MTSYILILLKKQFTALFMYYKLLLIILSFFPLDKCSFTHYIRYLHVLEEN